MTVGRVLALIGRAGPNALPLGIVLGLLLPDLAAIARPWLMPTIFLLLLLTLLRADLPQVAALARRPLRLALVLAFLLVGTPLVVAGLLALLDVPPALAQAIVLYALSAPIMSAAALALMLGLNAVMALVCTILATLLAPFTLPPLALALTGLDLDIGAGALMLRLAVLVGGALAGAMVVRRLAGASALEARRDQIAGAFVLLMLVFALSIMDSVVDRLASAPRDVAVYAAAAFAVNLGLQILGLAVLPWLGRDEGTAVVMMAGNRNMGVVIAALATPSDTDLFLFFALAQVPIFILPALLRPLYRRLGGALA